MRTFALTLAIGCLMANAALAGEACKPPAACTEVQTCGSPNQCSHCGCCSECEKCCKIVCEMKDVKKTVWVVHCEDFCVANPNCGLAGHGCDCCEGGCCEAGKAEPCCVCCEGNGSKCNPCAKEENKCFVPPKCGKVREKKTLEKKEVVCKVPSYKCVVVYTCAACGQCQQGEVAPPAAPAAPAAPDIVPPAPVPPPSKTTLQAPLPPVLGVSFQK